MNYFSEYFHSNTNTSNTFQIQIIFNNPLDLNRVHLIFSKSKMSKVIISNAVIKGYHEFQIDPPPTLALTVTKEYGDRHDANACLVWVPELESIPPAMWNIVTDNRRNHRWASHGTRPTRVVILL